ncbi:hypothetical protein [Paenibacillus xylanilyticus]|uniref:hypothetical protein n=1 Tax=Paenibacillus xylanilyticus TaxID=248903 RepID=UPI003AB05C6A
MAKYLRMLRDGADVTAGKLYGVITESIGAYEIKDDANDSHTFYKTGEGDRFEIYEETTADILASKRTQLAALTAEITQLEAQLAEESRLKVGDYARVTDTSSVDEFTIDDVVRISKYNGTAFPLRGECPVSGMSEWFSPAALTKITPAEAHASLIAKIDAHFNPEGGAESRG